MTKTAKILRFAIGVPLLVVGGLALFVGVVDPNWPVIVGAVAVIVVACLIVPLPFYLKGRFRGRAMGPPVYNPATGLRMPFGRPYGADIGGNPYGSNLHNNVHNRRP